jgi:adenylate cyclase class 2
VYEVEMKFPVEDTAAIESRLLGLGAASRGTVSQLDRYFNHPCRDFALTDEAVRLRQVGERVELTYKGPRVDAVTKTRLEHSLPLAATDALGGPRATVEAWTEVLVALGFRVVAEVAKERTVLSLVRESLDVEIAIDSVAGLGTYVELEVLAAEAGLAVARDGLLGLARELGLAASERRSYLELLLAPRGGDAGPPTAN